MDKLQGVNLGGWLVLERWITPRLFAGTETLDEYNLELKIKNLKLIDAHRRAFITEKDFAWMSQQGMNAVRIPVGHGVFGDVPPYRSTVEFLDLSFEWAAKFDLGIIIDLHTAPGSQNGWDHSGQAGGIDWHRNQLNIELTLNVLERLAQRYGQNPCLKGLELLNEPHWHIPFHTLRKFYEDGYRRIEPHLGPSASIIIHDAFGLAQWQHQLPLKDFPRLAIDTHLYQCFDDKDKKLTLPQHLQKAEHDWARLIDEAQQSHPLVIGEWSLGLDPGGFDEQTYQDYAQAQLKAFQSAAGWFFWTYKTEDALHWSFRDLVEQNLIDISPQKG